MGLAPGSRYQTPGSEPARLQRSGPTVAELSRSACAEQTQSEGGPVRGPVAGSRGCPAASCPDACSGWGRAAGLAELGAPCQSHPASVGLGCRYCNTGKGRINSRSLELPSADAGRTLWISDFRFVRYEVQAGHRDLRCAARWAAASAWPAGGHPTGLPPQCSAHPRSVRCYSSSRRCAGGRGRPETPT